MHEAFIGMGFFCTQCIEIFSSLEMPSLNLFIVGLSPLCFFITFLFLLQEPSKCFLFCLQIAQTVFIIAVFKHTIAFPVIKFCVCEDLKLKFVVLMRQTGNRETAHAGVLIV